MIRSWRRTRTLSAKRFCSSRTTTTAIRPSSDPLARWRRQVPDLRLGSVTYLANAAPVEVLREAPAGRSSRSRSGPSSRIPPLGLEKWFPALWLLTNCKNGISSYELGPRAWRDPEDRVVHALASASRVAGRAAAGSLAAKSKRTKPSSAARLATCTRPSGSASASRRAVR